MGDTDKSKISSCEMENLSLNTSRYPRDLLTRFTGSCSGWREGESRAIKEDGCEDDEEEEIELNLGLSLGGRLGIDKNSMKLIRSSSIAECLPIVKNEDDPLTSSSSPANSYSRLVRTTSLPVGSDEELRKRKELQTLRRMEAKKRRSEKRSQLVEKDKVSDASKRINSWVALPFGLPFGVSKGKGIQEFRLVEQQGSVESQVGSSSRVDNQSLGRTCSWGDTNLGKTQLLQSSNQEVGCSSRIETSENLVKTSLLDNVKPSKQSDTIKSNQTRETRANGLEDMPGVFTKGDGPNGRRVDGILYRYGRGQEVRIMCVCHGSFHSPVEFVKHAGGTDITHPLKHIVINPNSTPFT